MVSKPTFDKSGAKWPCTNVDDADAGEEGPLESAIKIGMHMCNSICLHLLYSLLILMVRIFCFP